jgi:hypothetical protein
VVVQGPAITTNFVGDFKLQAMPGDRIFVLIVCDVLYGQTEFNGYRRVADNEAGVNETALERSRAERDAALDDFDYDEWKRLYLEGNAGQVDDLLCNFRVQVSTSAQMINYSGVDVRRYGEGRDPAAAVARTAALGVRTPLIKDVIDAHEALATARLADPELAYATEVAAVATAKAALKTHDDAAGANGSPNATTSIPSSQRMGLRLGATMGEYIVGGWSMGTIVDSAASRASLPGQFASKRDPSSYALNVSTNVEWWTGDRIFRNYCDKEKTIRTRHQGTPEAGQGTTLLPHTPE